MSKNISVFRSPEGEAQYHAAYEAVLKEWPVSYEELFIPTRLGDTHVIASGPKDAAPLVLPIRPAAAVSSGFAISDPSAGITAPTPSIRSARRIKVFLPNRSAFATNASSSPIGWMTCSTG
jgi:hypothetical protein